MNKFIKTKELLAEVEKLNQRIVEITEIIEPHVEDIFTQMGYTFNGSIEIDEGEIIVEDHFRGTCDTYALPFRFFTDEKAVAVHIKDKELREAAKKMINQKAQLQKDRMEYERLKSKFEN